MSAKEVLEYEHKHKGRQKRQAHTDISLIMNKEMREITRITGGGELKLHGSSLDKVPCAFLLYSSLSLLVIRLSALSVHQKIMSLILQRRELKTEKKLSVLMRQILENNFVRTKEEVLF